MPGEGLRPLEIMSPSPDAFGVDLPTGRGERVTLARARHAGDRRHPLGAGGRREPHQRHGREPPRLGDLAPARLGRADRRVHQGKAGRLGRYPARPRGRVAHHRGLRAGRRRRLVRRRRARALPRQACERRLEESRRHPRRLVRLRLDARLRAGGCRAFPLARRHQAQARRRPRHRDVSGRLRPAPRLVSVLAPGILRHARARALRRRRHPRLHAGRGRPQDVEVARQHHRAAGRDQAVRRRYPAAVGRLLPTTGTTSASAPKSSRPRPTPIASCATPSAGCSATSRISARRSASSRRRCPSWNG